MTVLVAGGGIGGLTMALTCHEIGVPVTVLESVREIKPLGVGINLQPNAVRELMDLGLGPKLDSIGIPTKEWALVGRNGNDIWAEPRGIDAGYNWPQYSVHRGELQMLLYHEVLDRLGPDSVLAGHRVEGYRNRAQNHQQSGVEVTAHDRHNDATVTLHADVLLGADGLHSAIRAQMHPGESEPIWGGAVLWRGSSMGKPIRTGASFTACGSLDQRFIHYPISPVDPATGLQHINWIAELTFDPSGGWRESDWNRRADLDEFLPQFEDWTFDWLDIPQLIRSTDEIYEYPMVDRDPVDSWVDGNVALMGDAAHVMYPVGSNGASQAIIDARVIGAAFLKRGVSSNALNSYEAALLNDMSALVLRNRGAGPLAILGEVDKRCGGVFDDIDDVLERSEVEAFMARYKAAAGFAIEALNNAPPTIAPQSTAP